MSIQKALLSGSTNGKQIKIAATATLGTVIHQAVNSTADLDEIWLFADNSSASAVLLTIEWGGATDPDNIFEVNIPALGVAETGGPRLIIPGLLLNNNLSVTAFTSVANVIKISGYVHQIR